jgi:site-specific DNA-methyltransferase (adenine-specific)
MFDRSDVATCPTITPTQTVAIGSIKIGRRHRKDLGDIKALAASIEDLGLLQPIVIRPDCTLVAGMRRIQAAKELGWTEVPVRIVVGLDDALQLLKAERDENLCRLDFALSERVGMARELKPMEDEAAQQRMLAGKPCVESTQGSNGKVRDKFALAVGMGWQALEHAAAVIDAAEAEPEKYGDLVEEMDRTDKVNGAYTELCRRKEKERRQSQWEAVQAQPDYRPYNLIHADFREAEIEPDSIDVIITDPPYPREYLPLWADLSLFAARVLKPGGSLVAMSGQSYLPEIIAALHKSLTYHWTCSYLMPGGQPCRIWDRKVNTFWKPLLWYVKGEHQGEWIGDVCKSAVNDNDKDFHEWGQSESGMTDVIKRFSREGDLILDPFLGGGTTGFVALAMGRRFIGIDHDENAIKTCEARFFDRS